MFRLRSHTRTFVTMLGLVAAAVLVVGVVAGAAASGSQRPAEGERLLSGTHIGGVDVGGAGVQRAREQVAAHLADELSDPITVRAGGEVVDEVSPAELGAGVDVAAAVRRARERRADAPLWRRLATRVAPATAGPHVDVPGDVDVDRVAATVDALAERVDHAPTDAAVSWRDGELVTESGEPGRQLDREAAIDRLADAAAARAEEVALPVTAVQPDITEADIAGVAGELARSAQQAAERVVTVRSEQGRWRVAAGDVGATPDVATALRRAIGAGDATVEVPLTVDEDAVRARVEAIAAEVETPARPARLDTADGWVDIVDGRPGRRLDREQAVARLTRAFAEGDADVELPVETVAPARTRDDYRHVLLVRLNERRLYHYVDGEVAAEWPVAVGGGDSPTPTGEFVVGRKRYRPTWVNPDPDGWGADMPERIEPGRDNPLGLRALNWHRPGGGDTLIRFHGTAQTQSIGHAASQGCVRLTNDDVVELYERVPTGATIVSVRG